MFKSFRARVSPSLVISCIALLIALNSTGVAATGKSFVLGKANSANKQTQLTSGAGKAALKVTNNGSGPAASFNAKAGKAPFTVNRTTKVTNLNADQLDGMNASDFALVGAPFGDADTIDGLDSTAFALAGAPFGDATTLDGLDSLAFLLAAPGSVTSASILDDTAGGGLGPADLASSSVGAPEIATDAVGATEIVNDSIDQGEIVDFGLSNQDIGVLFAEVSSAGTLNNSSGGNPPVTVTKTGAAGSGTYEVDFGRTITTCTAVATLGGATTGTALGEVNVADRAGNIEAVFVDTNNSDGTAADKAFRLIVVC